MEGLGGGCDDFCAVGKSMVSLLHFLPAWTFFGSYLIGRI